MNRLIVTTLADFIVDGKEIHTAYLNYKGHGEPYIVWMNIDADDSFSGDDDLLGYVDFYDFDVYAKGNFTQIIEELKARLKNAGFTWNPSRTSADMYEEDTGYYHKTLCFSIHREV